MATSRWSKFALLMWKNWLLQWRHKVQSLVEILLPVLFSALLVLIRSLVDPENFPDTTKFEALEISTLDGLRNRTTTDVINWRLAYSPANEYLEEIIKQAVLNLNLSGYVILPNSSALEESLFQNNFLAGIEFDNSYSELKELPKQLAYTLRFPAELRTVRATASVLYANWRTDLLFPLFQEGGPRNKDWDDGGIPPGYHREGFVQIQNAISTAFIGLITKTASLPDIFLQRYPYPGYTDDVLLQGLERFVSLIILLSFVYPCINTVKFITTEKERQLKEAMKIMGLPSWLHWSAWFTKSLIFMMVSITLMVILLKVPWYPDTDVSVFTFTDWSVLWFFLFIYSISTIMFCFMLSVFFSKANTAAAVAGLVWFIFYSPYTFSSQNYGILSLANKLLVCLFSNTAMGYGFMLILRFEGSGEGLQWNNVMSPVSPDDNFTIGHVILMLLLDSLIYLLVTLYVEKILPGDFGVPEPWNFPFKKKFWFDVPEYVGITDSSTSLQQKENMEADPVGKHAGVQIKDLRKVYGNKKVAVQGLTLNMFEDQITVLLGHNGAGKTTTMSMLTGMFPPTTGTALINGKDIRTDIEGVRNSLGLCPQHNILFDELTVREHIIFFSRLKGLQNDVIEAEVQKYVKILELEPKINAQSHTLSGGMKRKLSVGVALCGGSKVVLCDEPTSGMDPAARRALWDLLQLEKKGRTILLSTHFMDEADILGDRIAIMAEGDLKCSGSSHFLKKKFGVGYHLICVKGPKCRSSSVTKLLAKYVPGVQIESEIGTELSYQLSEEFSSIFQTMFKELEEKSRDLDILSYGVSLTTLEEVFMKVGSDLSKREESNGVLNGVDRTDSENGSVWTLDSHDTTPLLKGGSLTTNQILAMFQKKFWNTLRNWIIFLIQVIIPMIFIILTILVVRTWAGGTDLPTLSMNLNGYHKTVTVLQRPITTETTNERLITEYRKLFANMPGTTQLHEISEDMETYILNLSKTLITRINAQYIVGATITANNITAWYNNQPYHGAPLALNLLHNAMLNALDCVNCGIKVSNHPMPFLTSSRLEMLEAGNNMGFQLSFNLGFAMAFVSAFYILFYIKERVSRAKLLQFVSGVNVLIFWVTAIIWDYFTFTLTSIILIATLAVFQEDGWSTVPELGRTFVMLLVFGFAVLPVTYLASLLFSIPATGFTRMTMFNIFTGIACFSITFIMGFEAFDLKDIADGLTWFFMLFPHFAFSEGLNKMNLINTASRVCDRCFPPLCSQQFICQIYPICCNLNYFDWGNGVGRNITYMMTTGIALFGVLLLWEFRVFESIFYKGKNIVSSKIPVSEDGYLDSDVQEEKNRINAMGPGEIKSRNLVMQNMTKFYGSFLAVNQLSVAVEHSECFGLLGVNGAGKTSTFKMMTGDEQISRGEAFVKGISLKNNMNIVHQHIGYCPQFDALIEDLTGRETLMIFSLLRGVPYNRIKNLSIQLATQFNYLQHFDKKVKDYSGGNKRKLSTSVALIGNPSVVYLDEPTTGMDPGAKRQLWNMVCKVRNSGKSIVLTSHSMEECEALCTRLAIMVNGEFKCLGSTQHLKNKFSKGYILTLRIKRKDPSEETLPNSNEVFPLELQEDVKKAKEYILKNFAGATLKEEYQCLLTYYIPTTMDLTWSDMFGIMEGAKTTLRIEDYSLSQTSLEQVFLSFTKYQREDNQPTN